MGKVYKARDKRLDRFVAIKILPEHVAKREDLRQRFEREARAVASLNHPHLCVLYDIGSQDGTEYMVMECLEGETLAARLAKGALPLDQALRFAVQIADALDCAHRAGVTHRDIKPNNIVLTRDGVKLLDFGLAKSGSAKPGPSDATLTQALTAEGTVLGTPQYMAPSNSKAGRPTRAATSGPSVRSSTRSPRAKKRSFLSHPRRNLPKTSRWLRRGGTALQGQRFYRFC